MKIASLLFTLAIIASSCSSQTPKEVIVDRVVHDTITYHDTITINRSTASYKLVENTTLYSYVAKDKKKPAMNCSIYQLPTVLVCVITIGDKVHTVSEAEFLDADEFASAYRLKDLGSLIIYQNEIVLEYDHEVNGTKTLRLLGGNYE